jgi:hypothetical protein
MDIKSAGYGYNSPQFLGKVDSSVVKYVKAMKEEAKTIYVKDCQKTGMAINPTAFKVIEKRCNTALEKLNKKAYLLHEDTVITVTKNPYKKDGGVYLSAENKNLLHEWEQKGAVNRFNIYNNNLRATNKIHNGYDKYITGFEGFVDRLNPTNLDVSMIRTSISNLWNLNIPRLTRKNYAEKYAESTQNVADKIGYSTTFYQSFCEHLKDARMQLCPKKIKKESLLEKIKNIFS